MNKPGDLVLWIGNYPGAMTTNGLYNVSRSVIEDGGQRATYVICNNGRELGVYDWGKLFINITELLKED